MRSVARAAACAAALSPLPAAARDPQTWTQASIGVDLGGGWQVAAEASKRSAANERADQLLLRAHAARRLSKRTTLWIGYVRAETYNDDRRNGLEQRATGQLDWEAGMLGPFRLVSRTRLEARFIRGGDGTSWRAREQLRLVLPRGRTSIAVGVEPFLALNRTDAARRTLEQLRLTANVTVKLSEMAELDIGYIHQQLFRPGERIVNHVVPATVRIRL